MTSRYYENSLKFKVLYRITQMTGNVVLREDIQDMGSPRQISRCFKDLSDMGELIKIGYGVYAKAYISKYVDRPILKGGFGSVCKEALTKLEIQWEPGLAEQEYNAGLTTQIPVKTVVRLKNRFRRNLGYGGRNLVVENGINSR